MSLRQQDDDLSNDDAKKRAADFSENSGKSQNSINSESAKKSQISHENSDENSDENSAQNAKISDEKTDDLTRDLQNSANAALRDFEDLHNFTQDFSPNSAADFSRNLRAEKTEKTEKTAKNENLAEDFAEKNAEEKSENLRENIQTSRDEIFRSAQNDKNDFAEKSGTSRKNSENFAEKTETLRENIENNSANNLANNLAEKTEKSEISSQIQNDKFDENLPKNQNDKSDKFDKNSREKSDENFAKNALSTSVKNNSTISFGDAEEAGENAEKFEISAREKAQISAEIAHEKNEKKRKKLAKNYVKNLRKSANFQKIQKIVRTQNRAKINKILLAIIIIFILAAAVFAILFLTGKFYAGFKKSAEKVVVFEKVCGDEIIKKYNEIYVKYATTAENMQKPFENLRDEIEKKENFAQDATCEAIIFQGELRYGNVEEARKNLATLKNLTKNGLYVSPDLMGDNSLRTMEDSATPVSEVLAE